MSMTPDIWDRSLSLFHRIEAELTVELRNASDLGVSDFRTLRHLLLQPKREMRMQQLAELLQLTQSSTTRLVERLERRGFVYRDSCPSDGRGKFCVLTEQGAAYAARAIPHYEQALEQALKTAFEDADARETARRFAALAEI